MKPRLSLILALLFSRVSLNSRCRLRHTGSAAHSLS